MTKVHQQLEAIKANSVPAILALDEAWQMFCDKHATLFERALISKPDTPEVHHLLGILTKAHIEETASLTSHKEASEQMREVLQTTLGEHADKFQEQGSQQLLLVTHLWLYVQGYLKMDFSLANDHAMNSAELLTVSNNDAAQALRTQFLESYYLGVERSPVKTQQSKIVTWFKQLFN
ncbi:hypothetical protein F0231_08800 [Vibrio sp. RE86]|uniref:hypothetical protein n=1 Tax=Vibrio sp. RE86 TaxID=2607605 RepID=UPI0014933321|nr:hypothetical protein [Vibrio sp. RE86]NOH79844.1 hypothetical protein [Vibrio sp. RE86]